MSDLIRNIHHAGVGKTYKVVLGPDNLPALQLVETRGRPRALTGEQVIAARALRKSGMTLEAIAKVLSASVGAVRTATGAPR